MSDTSPPGSAVSTRREPPKLELLHRKASTLFVFPHSLVLLERLTAVLFSLKYGWAEKRWNGL
ncbi:MAG: hypothetical protein RMY28_010075 [Nostoc sp. ChiSLP01]|nr:hypothetical protein [Nostoc sp. CmiSLP01]MDZ8285098.1 hypothetical protein [Nostoc sp. ChiSLP01]